MTKEEVRQCYQCDGYEPCLNATDHFVPVNDENYCGWKQTVESDILKYKEDGNSACLTFNIKDIVDAQKPKYFNRITIGGYLDHRMQLQAQGYIMGFDNDEMFEIYKSKHINDLVA